MFATVILVIGPIGLIAGLIGGGYYIKKKLDYKNNVKTVEIDPSKLINILDEWDKTQNNGCIKEFDVSINILIFYDLELYWSKWFNKIVCKKADDYARKHNLTTNVALSENNKDKNRYDDILPCEFKLN